MTIIDELRIRDLSRSGGSEWIPPISAMGGPPGHELYRDLVLHAGMRLYRGPTGEAWVVLQDGERRRAYRVPSAEIVNAFDRFRMRRNLRPVPEKDIDDFVRTIQARVSDPDARLPTIDPRDTSFAVASSLTEEEPTPETLRAPTPVASFIPEEPDLPVEPGLIEEVASPSISGGIMASPSPDGGAETLPLYVRVLRDMVRHGDWLGTLSDLSSQIGEDSFTVFASLLKYRAALAQSGVVIAPVETEEGWRWLAVDRGRLVEAQ